MTTYLYVSLQDDDRISRFVLDPSTGALEHCGDTTVAGMPAPMAIDPQKRFLFAGRRQPGEFGLSSFRIDPATGGLSLIGGVPLQGNPVHIATDRKGNYLLSAYYYQARTGVHAIGDDGALTGQPVEWLETGTGAHYVQTDPTNRYAFVPHIAEGTHSGMNAIFQFRFDESTGRLTPNSPDRAVPNGPDGPRHLCFHPKAGVVYSSDEQGSSVTAYNLDPEQGTLSPFQTVSTLPAGYDGHNSCSQIQIAPSGNFLYAPNRGHNSIAWFGVDAADGRLNALGRVSTEPVPRAFSLDPSGAYLYAAGLESGRLASYRVDGETGALEPLAVYPVGTAPMWVLIIDL